jgi:hypothetical protein
MSLSSHLAETVDRVFRAESKLAPFRKLKPASGNELRAYYAETSTTQREVLFYRDKWWTKGGGKAFMELICLVPVVQRALSGTEQSLADPDYSKPFNCFQYAMLEPNPRREWTIHSEQDISSFEADLRRWLPTYGITWLEQFESLEGVITFMRANKQLTSLALLHAFLGDKHVARENMIEWLRSHPRQIERHLQSLVGAGLLSEIDKTKLLLASVQREDLYRDQLEAWISCT